MPITTAVCLLAEPCPFGFNATCLCPRSPPPSARRRDLLYPRAYFGVKKLYTQDSVQTTAANVAKVFGKSGMTTVGVYRLRRRHVNTRGRRGRAAVAKQALGLKKTPNTICHRSESNGGEREKRLLCSPSPCAESVVGHYGCSRAVACPAIRNHYGA